MGTHQQSFLPVQSLSAFVDTTDRIVTTRGLTKRYGDVIALHDCTFHVAPGEIFGMLGPNGAGKTTLIRTLLGFLRPTEGTATIDGLDCHRDAVAVHRAVSYLPAEAKLFRRMKAVDVLRFFASLRGQNGFERSCELAQKIDLDIRRRVALMSTGMRQKLALVVALAKDAKLLILDEPTSSLDPNVRRVVIELIRDISRQGTTVLFSSHVLSEVEDICDRVMILRDGELVHTQDLHQLKDQHTVRAISETNVMPVVPDALAEVVHITGSPQRLTVIVEGDLAPVLQWLAQLSLKNVTIDRGGLRSIYERFHRVEGS